MSRGQGSVVCVKPLHGRISMKLYFDSGFKVDRVQYETKPEKIRLVLNKVERDCKACPHPGFIYKYSEIFNSVITGYYNVSIKGQNVWVDYIGLANKRKYQYTGNMRAGTCSW